MIMNLIIYEDQTDNFSPLIALYPQFKLRMGIKTIYDHIKSQYPGVKINFICRDIFKTKPLNLHGPVLYLSARALPLQTIKTANQDTIFMINKAVIGFLKLLPPFPHTIQEIEHCRKKIKKVRVLQGYFLNNMFDLIKYNELMIIKHYNTLRQKSKAVKNADITGDKNLLFVARRALVHKQVFIDLEAGPVIIDEQAEIRPFTTIIGPSYIGPGTIIDRAKIIKSSIGPCCRIGGEVESSIFQGYTNKYHEGFIGHSFIGEWVNLGALTTNSDLKNNYSSVRSYLNEKEVDSGMIKLGCFIGDHTKLGIGTLIPTGAVIGSFVNFFGGGTIPKYVAAFKWLSLKKEDNYDLERAIKTAKAVMARRQVKVSSDYLNLIKTLYKWQTSL